MASAAIKMTILLAALLGGLYPGAVWLAGQFLFRPQANGSLLVREGAVRGSKLIGQGFAKPEYFHGRPSAAGYDAANSSGSNLGPTNQKLFDRVEADVDRLLAENPGLAKGRIPVDLVTASASGLDPDISPEAAGLQVNRVAKARKLSPEALRALVAAHTEGPQWGIFGEARVNVLLLNAALDLAPDLAPGRSGQ